MHVRGLGVPQDYNEAVKWFRLGAEQGHAGAQSNLGVKYYRGEGVPQDYREAVKWYRLAAEQGHARAQFYLGNMYGRGEGVPQDYREGEQWIRLAAMQGFVEAQYTMGQLHGYGYGIPVDWVHAHAWSNLAAAQGHEEAREYRDELQDLMTREQVIRAQRMASEWVPNSPLPLGNGTAFVQRALYSLDYEPGPIDGRIGPRTRAAIRSYQHDHGLPVDGQISSILQDALWDELANR